MDGAKPCEACSYTDLSKNGEIGQGKKAARAFFAKNRFFGFHVFYATSFLASVFFRRRRCFCHLFSISATLSPASPSVATPTRRNFRHCQDLTAHASHSFPDLIDKRPVRAFSKSVQARTARHKIRIFDKRPVRAFSRSVQARAARRKIRKCREVPSARIFRKCPHAPSAP